MKKILLTLLTVILVLGVVAAAGFTGYRFGYVRGIQATTNGQTPDVRPFDEMGPNRMPMHNFDNRFERAFDRGLGPGGFPMRERGFGFFTPLRFIGQILIIALIVWFAYWLFTRSGWQITRTRTVQTIETQPKPTETEAQE